MKRALHAEWTKLRTVRTTPWLLFGLVAGTAAIGTLVAWTVPAADGPAADLARLSLAGVYCGQIAVVVLATLAVTEEYPAGLIRTTLAAYPRRLTVYAAKAIVVTAIVLGCAALGVLGAIGGGRLALDGHRVTPALSLADGATMRAAGGTVLYCGLIALLCLGVGTAVRHTAGALSTVLSVLYVYPMLIAFLNRPNWIKWATRFSPMQAGLSIQVTKRLERLVIAPWPGLGVLALYAVAATILGAILFVTRDA